MTLSASIKPQKHVTFIDASLPDYQTLIDGLPEGMEVVRVNPDQDGIQVMGEWAAKHSDYDAIHILGHGSEGAQQLGNATLSNETLETYQAELTQIGKALTEGGDILLYGCNVAANETGVEFIGKLAQVTGADIAASDDLTGAVSLGGDWILEQITETKDSYSTSLNLMQFNAVLSQVSYNFDTEFASDQNAALGKSSISTIHQDLKLTAYDSYSFGWPRVASQTSDHNILDNDGESGPDRALVVQGAGVGSSAGAKTLGIEKNDGALFTPISVELGIFTYRANSSADPDADTLTIMAYNSSGTEVGRITYSPVYDDDYITLDFSNPASGYTRDNGSFSSAPTITSSGSFSNISELKVQIGHNTFYMDNLVITNTPLADTTAPLFENSTPSTSNVSATSLDLTTDIDEGGTAYYVVVADGATAPNAEEVKAGTASGGASAVASGSQAVSTGGFSHTFSLSGLTASTAYDIYVVAEDDEGTPNLQASVTKVDVTTAAPPNNPPTVTGAPSDIITLNEDTQGNIDLSAVTFSDDDGDTLTVTLTASAGTFAAPADGSSVGSGVTETLNSGSGSNVITLVGSTADINTYLNTASNIQYTGAENASGENAATITITASDGKGGNLASNPVVNLDITAVNDAPMLDNSGSPTLATIDEDSPSNTGTLVSEFLGKSLEDADASDSQGIAVTAVDNTNGTWQYSTDGTNWSSVGTVSDSSALLLASDDELRFVPNADYNGSAAVNYRGWDQTSGTAGNKVDVSTNGGTTAFSTATESASVTINSVNDAPTLSGGPYTFTTTDEDTTTTGVQISTLLGEVTAADADGDTLGAAITAQAGNGTWQYSTDSTNGNDGLWSDFGTVSDTSALLLSDTTYVRYNPDGKHGEVASLTLRAWDGTSGSASTYKSNTSALGPGPSSGPVTADTSNNGDATAFSTGNITASLTVTSIVDLPEITGLDGDTVSISITGYDYIDDIDVADATVIDVDSADMNGGYLLITQTSGTKDGSFLGDDLSMTSNGLRFGATESAADETPEAGDTVWYIAQSIGTVDNIKTGQNGADFQIHLNTNSSPENVGYILNYLRYGAATEGARTFSATVNDGDGGTSAAASFTVTVVDDTKPVATSYTDSTNEDTAVTAFSNTELPTAGDSDTGTAQTIEYITIDTSTVTGGVLSLTGTPKGGSSTTGGITFTTTTSDLSGTVNIAIGDIGNLVFTPTTNLSGTGAASFAWTVTDSGGDTSPAATYTLDITEVNDAPTLTATGANPNFSAGGQAVALFSAAQIDTVESGQGIQQLVLTVSHVSDTGKESLIIDGQALDISKSTKGTSVGAYSATVTFSSGNAMVTLDLSGGNHSVTDVQSLITSMKYRNEATPLTEADRVVTLTAIQDDGGTANGGIDTVNGLTLSSTVSALNNSAPVATDTSVTLSEDTPYTFSLVDFGFSDSDTGDSLHTLKITQLPALGQLLLNGNAVTQNMEITQDQLTQGALTYTAATNDFGQNYSQFSVQVSDGTVFSDNSATVTLSVNAINDAPEGQPVINGLAEVAQILTADTSGIQDIDGLGVLRYQWLRDGTAIQGAQLARYEVTETDAGAQISLLISYQDQGGTIETVRSASTAPVPLIEPTTPTTPGTPPIDPVTPPTSDNDNDGIPASEEDVITSMNGSGRGDGNGDGTPDSQQVNVASKLFRKTDQVSNNPDADTISVTLDARNPDDPAVVVHLRDVGQMDAPEDKPDTLSMPLGLIEFKADVTNPGDIQHFSLLVDPQLPVNGYWKQLKTGQWVNLASELYGGSVTTVGQKTQVNFFIQDGGVFDDDGVADGVITDPGALGYQEPSANPEPLDPFEGTHAGHYFDWLSLG